MNISKDYTKTSIIYLEFLWCYCELIKFGGIVRYCWVIGNKYLAPKLCKDNEWIWKESNIFEQVDVTLNRMTEEIIK